MSARDIFGKKERRARMFPTRIYLSKKTWDRLQYLQTQTRLTPNIVARIALSLALRDIRTASVNENKPEQTHIINRDVLFGDQENTYEVLIRQFYAEQNIDYDIQDVLRSLIDSGLHKMGHIKSLIDIQTFFLK